MYLDSRLPIPDIKGKITLKKKGGSCYVLYEIDRVYDPERKFNIPKRSVIGKLDSDNPSQMIPNENFLKHFPNTPFASRSATSAPLRSSTISVGPHIAFERIIKEYGLRNLLEKCFGDQAGLILDLVSYLIVSEDNAAQYYPDYARKHALFTRDMDIVSDSTVSRLLSGVSKDQITQFLDVWNSQKDHRQRIYVSYDSTNKNSQGGDIDLVEFGHPKEDRGLPIINVSLAYDKTNRVPLFYEEYPGSINDVSQLVYLIEKIHTFGYRNIGFILDRGYFSRANIEFIEEKGFHFLMMVKGCKSLVSSMIEQHCGTFETDWDNRISEGGVYGITIKRELYPSDAKNRYFHLFFSRSKMSAESDEFEQKIERMAAELQKLEGYTMDEKSLIGKPYTDYFTPHYKDLDNGKKQFLFAAKNKQAIARALRLCGYFCLISSSAMTATEAYRLYRGRDVSEKLFRADKTFLGSKSWRVHSNEAVSTKIFLEFVALIIRNRFYNLIKDEMQRLNIRRNWMTVPAALRELGKLEMTKRNGKRYLMDYALTRTQKQIFQCFGLNEEEVIKATQGIADVLANTVEKPAEYPEGDEDAQAQNDCFD